MDFNETANVSNKCIEIDRVMTAVNITITITSCLDICLIDCFTIVKPVQSYEHE
jgi:hypothetical protein